MEGLRTDSQACGYIAGRLRGERFTLIDVGCSGGIDPIWRVFGERLRAFGFDPNVAECERLGAAEKLPGVRYVAGFVGLPKDDPILRRRGDRPQIARNPWTRLSAARTVALRAKANERSSDEQLTRQNLWQQVPLADPDKPIVLADFLREQGVADIDLLKIDVDGADFDILQSLEHDLASRNVLAVGLEVNFVGSHEPTDHTFHNTDRFMRALGFDLFHLTVRPYSAAALPGRYTLPMPAQTNFGRPLQGDALYVRDFAAPEHRAAAAKLPAAKIAKTAAIFAGFGLVDCAAELVLAERVRLSDLLNVDELLDVLCADGQGDAWWVWPYARYMAEFEREHRWFFPEK